MGLPALIFGCFQVGLEQRVLMLRRKSVWTGEIVAPEKGEKSELPTRPEKAGAIKTT
jgi:hypothetical protein